jgi:hypothetical protein
MLSVRNHTRMRSVIQSHWGGNNSPSERGCVYMLGYFYLGRERQILDCVANVFVLADIGLRPELKGEIDGVSKVSFDAEEPKKKLTCCTSSWSAGSTHSPSLACWGGQGKVYTHCWESERLAFCSIIINIVQTCLIPTQGRQSKSRTFLHVKTFETK